MIVSMKEILFDSLISAVVLVHVSSSNRIFIWRAMVAEVTGDTTADPVEEEEDEEDEDDNEDGDTSLLLVDDDDC